MVLKTQIAQTEQIIALQSRDKKLYLGTVSTKEAFSVYV